MKLFYDMLHNWIEFFIHALMNQFFLSLMNQFFLSLECSLKCNKWLSSASNWCEQQTHSQIFCHWNKRKLVIIHWNIIQRANMCNKKCDKPILKISNLWNGSFLKKYDFGYANLQKSHVLGFCNFWFSMQICYYQWTQVRWQNKKILISISLIFKRLSRLNKNR